jgi:hypothetical protein
MSTDAKAAPPKRKLTVADLEKIPYVGLWDEKRRLWGFFTPEDAGMLKAKKPEEWYALARKLLAEHTSGWVKLIVIPYEEKDGQVRGRFVLTPWSDRPVTPPTFTEQELDEMEAMCNEKSQMLTPEEFRELVLRDLQEDD